MKPISQAITYNGHQQWHLVGDRNPVKAVKDKPLSVVVRNIIHYQEMLDNAIHYGFEDNLTKDIMAQLEQAIKEAERKYPILKNTLGQHNE